jgi:hypothetical protein
MRFSAFVIVAVAFGQDKPLEFDGQITTISQTHGPVTVLSLGLHVER